MTKTKATNLRPTFSAIVRTTEEQVVPTALGNVKMPVEVHVKAGGKLPDNLADGEYERLEQLGAFEPWDPFPTITAGLAQPVSGSIAGQPAVAAGQAALAALPGDEAKTTADVRFPSEAELAAREGLARAQADVRDAIAEAQAEAATPNDVDAKPARKAK